MNIYQKLKKFKFSIEKIDIKLSESKLIEPYKFTKNDNILGIDSLDNTKQHHSLFCDFLSHKMQQRFEDAYYNKSQLIKAFGKSLIRHSDLTILDATSGFGYDALEMSVKAKKIIMLEQSEIVYALLQDGLERLQKEIEIDSENQIYQEGLDLEITSFNKTFQDYVKEHNLENEHIDIVYLDPMYPKENKKSAQNKKYMQYLQEVTKNSIEDTDLLDLALKVAKHKIILKRPLYAEVIYPKKVCYQVKSKLVRYDVYLP